MEHHEDIEMIAHVKCFQPVNNTSMINATSAHSSPLEILHQFLPMMAAFLLMMLEPIIAKYMRSRSGVCPKNEASKPVEQTKSTPKKEQKEKKTNPTPTTPKKEDLTMIDFYLFFIGICTHLDTWIERMEQQFLAVSKFSPADFFIEKYYSSCTWLETKLHAQRLKHEDANQDHPSKKSIDELLSIVQDLSTALSEYEKQEEERERRRQQRRIQRQRMQQEKERGMVREIQEANRQRVILEAALGDRELATLAAFRDREFARQEASMEGYGFGGLGKEARLTFAEALDQSRTREDRGWKEEAGVSVPVPEKREESVDKEGFFNAREDLQEDLHKEDLTEDAGEVVQIETVGADELDTAEDWVEVPNGM